jgi:signal transduction histidine kinase
MNQGILFMSQETPKPDSALYYMFKSLDMLKDIYEQNKSGNTENALMFNIGEIYEEDGKYEDALKYFEKLYLHSIKNQHHTTQYNALYHIGKCNYLSGKIKTGKRIIAQALRDAKYYQDGHIVAEIHKNLAEIYTKEGKLELALKHEKEYSNYLDSIYIKKLAIAPAYVLQRKDMYFNKMQEAKAQSDYQESQRLLHLKNLQLKYLVVFSLVCVLGFYVFFKFKSRLQEQKQTIDDHKLTIDKNKVQIQQKEKEIAYIKAFNEGQEKVKKDIAMTLHDSVAASLAAIKMKLQNKQSKMCPQEVEMLILELNDAYKMTRDLSHAMMPPIFGENSFIEVMEDFCNKTAANFDIQFNYNFFPEEQLNLLPKEHKIEIFRIVQELTINALKYAHAHRFELSLLHHEFHYVIIFEDNGMGMHKEKKHHGIGLQNIEERLKYLNGRMNIDSQAQQGTTFIIEIPYHIHQISNTII